MNPSAESFSSTTSWLMMVGSIVRTACGTSTSRVTAPLVSPMLYAASVCPRGTALIPARKISASTDPL